MAEFLIWGALLIVGHELDLLVKELRLIREDTIRLVRWYEGDECK